MHTQFFHHRPSRACMPSFTEESRHLYGALQHNKRERRAPPQANTVPVNSHGVRTFLIGRRSETLARGNFLSSTDNGSLMRAPCHSRSLPPAADRRADRVMGGHCSTAESEEEQLYRVMASPALFSFPPLALSVSICFSFMLTAV